MRLEVKVIPKAKANTVTQRQGKLVIRVTAPADRGLANEAVSRLLAEHLKVSRSRIRIVRGVAARRKVIEVLDPHTNSGG